MNDIECESCVKRKTMYCPNSFKCYATKDKPYWQNRIQLLEENKELHNKIDKAIEYIENNTYSSVHSMKTTLYLQNDELYDLLKILKDSDVDE